MRGALTMIRLAATCRNTSVKRIAGGNDGGVAYHGHQIAMTARLRPQNAEAVLRVMEGDPLDEASEHFLCRRLRIRLHTD